ncbi:hypothetical protein BH24BAC1_BH24BAC1_35660 [soil metagenome]
MSQNIKFNLNYFLTSPNQPMLLFFSFNEAKGDNLTPSKGSITSPQT